MLEDMSFERVERSRNLGKRERHGVIQLRKFLGLDQSWEGLRGEGVGRVREVRRISLLVEGLGRRGRKRGKTLRRRRGGRRTVRRKRRARDPHSAGEDLYNHRMVRMDARRRCRAHLSLSFSWGGSCHCRERGVGRKWSRTKGVLGVGVGVA